MFELVSGFTATDDQQRAVSTLSDGVFCNKKNQTLLGVTGSGKTFTMANVIAKTRLPTLIISHNKTLAGQLYQEMRDFFPNNAVSYFVSYYDFYQPEAYIPATDTYIEKEATINDLIDKLRLATTSNILTRKDVIVVASVSCIYNIGSPEAYGKNIINLILDKKITVKKLTEELVRLQYERSEFDFRRGTFRIRGQQFDIYPAYEDQGVRIHIENDTIIQMARFDVVSGKKLQTYTKHEQYVVYPAKHFITDDRAFDQVEGIIRKDLEKEYAEHKKKGKLFEAERLLKKVNYDLEILKEVGYVNGIENYSRYFDGRKPGDPPFSLLSFFKHAYGSDWMVCIDESHMTVPQIRGMYNGDRSRKQTLVDYGFRLTSAFDNRPLRFDEFYERVEKIIYVSATPNEWEIKESGGISAEQLVRPTGILDPKVTVRPSDGEIVDLCKEIEIRIEKKERVLATTLTKRTAEDLTEYLQKKGIRAEYLHSDIKTLERTDILNKLRKNEFDVLVGINLLREGLDLPEVTLVAILDAENEGFLRSKTALIQTMGRAARNAGGEVIMYANHKTRSMIQAIAEIERRRTYQIAYNKKHGIVPTTIIKQIRESITPGEVSSIDDYQKDAGNALITRVREINTDGLTPYDKKKLIHKLRSEMKKQAQDMHFEVAITLRDMVKKIENEL